MSVSSSVPVLRWLVLLSFTLNVYVYYSQQTVVIQSAPIAVKQKACPVKTVVIHSAPIAVKQKACPVTPCECQSDLSNIDGLIRLNNDILPPRGSRLPAAALCARKGACLPAYATRASSLIKAAPRSKLMSCAVEKSMSTIMTAIVCYLSDPESFKRSESKFITEANGGLCKDNANFEFNSFDTMKLNLSISENPGWLYTFVTRDPIDRFLSAFIDRCIRTPMEPYCNGCHQNMTCFIMSEYERFSQQVRDNKFPATFEDNHFTPQHWRCDLSSHFEDYRFIRYSSDPSEKLMTDLINILHTQNITSDDTQFIRDQLTAGRTRHSTVQSKARRFLEERLRSSPFLMEYLVRMFYHDFQLFNYPLPDGF